MTDDSKPKNARDLGSFLKYARDLFRFLSRRLRNLNDVRDAEQEVYARLLRKDLDAIEHPKAYMMAVADKVLAEWGRSKAVRDKYVTTDSELIERQSESFCEQEAKDPFVRWLVRRAIASLPANEREVLHYWEEGLSCDETAELLKLSPNTVRKYLVRAKLKVRMIVVD